MSNIDTDTKQFIFLLNKYKGNIDDKLATMGQLRNAKNIYGGQTEHTIKERKKQHARNDKKFNKQCIILKLTPKKTEDKFTKNKKQYTKDLVNRLEAYLIIKLRQINSNVSNIADNGRGIQNDSGDTHKLYILYLT